MAVYLGMNTNGLGQPTSSLVNQLNSFRGFNGLYTQSLQSWNNQWSGLYTSVLINNELLLKQATTNEEWAFAGVAQVIKAHVFSQMVDVWGDIPYSEALNGQTTFYPHFEDDAAIYNGPNGLLALLDAAIANLERPGGTISNDIIYRNDKSKWLRLARTLKLKLLNQERLYLQNQPNNTLTQQVNDMLGKELLGGSGATPTPGDDFELAFSALTNPENRHPGYQSDYVNAGRENLIGSQFYELMADATRNSTLPDQRDPRIPYYFFNQYTGGSTGGDVQFGNFVTLNTGSTLASSNSPTRTLPGLYPYGGRYDDGNGTQNLGVDQSFARGVVAQRLLPTFSRYFIEAELQQTVLNNNSAARTAFEKGVRAAFAKVNAIAAQDGSQTTPDPQKFKNYVVSGSVPQIAVAVIDTYVTAALARFDAEPLRAIITEKYIASFGMGVDQYTDFRRTKFPEIRVPDLAQSPGTFADIFGTTTATSSLPRRLAYPQADLLSNPNAPKQQPNFLTDRIFWDLTQ